MKLDALVAHRGELGVSDWLPVPQTLIDGFADLTGDHQWIHVDVARAKQGPYGATIAHGFLVVSLLPQLVEQVLVIDNQTLGLNYGFNRVRFIGPVRADDRIRLRCSVQDVAPRDDGYLLTLGLAIEVEGQERPTMVGEFLTLVSDKEVQDD
jgi:acyl dehydratase